MRIVIAIGGNALLERGQKPDAAIQQENARRAVEALAPLAARHEVVVTHGNGFWIPEPHRDVPAAPATAPHQ